MNKAFCVFLSGVGFFCICTAVYRWVYVCAVTHAVYCSDSRLCGEDSVVQWWLNPWDSKRSVLRKTLKRPADQRRFKLDNSVSTQQVRFLSYFRYIYVRDVVKSKYYCLNHMKTLNLVCISCISIHWQLCLNYFLQHCFYVILLAASDLKGFPQTPLARIVWFQGSP